MLALLRSTRSTAYPAPSLAILLSLTALLAGCAGAAPPCRGGDTVTIHLPPSVTDAQLDAAFLGEGWSAAGPEDRPDGTRYGKDTHGIELTARILRIPAASDRNATLAVGLLSQETAPEGTPGPTSIRELEPGLVARLESLQGQPPPSPDVAVTFGGQGWECPRT